MTKLETRLFVKRVHFTPGQMHTYGFQGSKSSYLVAKSGALRPVQGDPAHIFVLISN